MCEREIDSKCVSVCVFVCVCVSVRVRVRVREINPKSVSGCVRGRERKRSVGFFYKM